MIWLIVFGILCIIGSIVFTWYLYETMCQDFSDIVVGLLGSALGTLLVMLIVTATIIPMTTGLLKNYSTGVREGFVTKISIKGIIWKTNEAQIQVGTGQMAALQEPFSFSIYDEKLLERLKEALGKKIRISYVQWVILPYRKGKSNYLLTDIIILN